MSYLSTFPVLDHTPRHVDDIFSLEYRPDWAAREARQAAELSPGLGERPSSARRSLAQALSAATHRAAGYVRRLDGADLRRSRSAAE